MAAILPYLEQQDDPAETPAQEANWTVPADVSQASATEEEGFAGVDAPGIAGVADERIFYTAELNAEVLNQSHAELLQTAWLRHLVTDQLMGNSFTVQARNARGAEPRNVFIVLDHPVAPHAAEGDNVIPWNPPATPDARSFKLLSWTSKMGSPSFSLPSGPTQSGGSCPGAVAGQSIVPVGALHGGSKLVERVLGRPVRLQQAICQYCYAHGGQYGTGGVQFAQVLRYIWTRMALKDGSFVETMLYAIEQTKWHLEAGAKVDKMTYKRERHPGLYFRIHDSGDFFSRDYIQAWKDIADARPDIIFWAPTRVWATSWGIDAVNEINGDPRNLIIRPSAFHTNENAPQDLGPGFAKGTVVYHKDHVPQGAAEGKFQWDCQAYAVPDHKASCRNAIAPDGKAGCRACWRYGADAVINYTLH